MALVLFVIIVFSVIIKALTHLFTLGYFPSPVLINVLPHEGVVPSLEDDFGVALLKLGTACIEATQYSGLRNELVSVQQKSGPWVDISASGSEVKRVSTPGGFGTEINNIEVSELSDPNTEQPYWKELKAFGRACIFSLAGFGWSMLMAIPGGLKAWEKAKAVYHGRWWYGPRSWRFWRRAAWAEPPVFQQRATLRRLEDVARRRNLEIEWHSQMASQGVSTTVQLRQPTPAPIQYSQILRGEVVVEDDEVDWQEDNDDSSSETTGASNTELEEESYRDLRESTAPLDDVQPVLLAHLASEASTPLTRRRYAAILADVDAVSKPQQELQGIVQARRSAVQVKDRDEWDDDRRRCCVVCTIEPRDTILWPCRCVARWKIG